jgi:elongation factor Ts
MNYPPTLIAEIRQRTGLGILEIKKALDEKNGVVEDVIELLKKRSASKVVDLGKREANEGVIHAYVHQGAKTGCIIEVNCETDFVARNEEFRAFVSDLCLQIVAASPKYVSRNDVPADEIAAIRDQALSNESLKNKPQHVREKIADGKVNQHLETICLLDQPFVKDTNRKVSDLLTEIGGKFKEKIVVRRFTRYEIGK